MNSNFIHHKSSTPNINKISKDINLIPKENSQNTFNNINNNKTTKLNNLSHSLSSNKNIILQPSNNFFSKLIQPDKLKNFYNFYEKENSKKLETNFNDVFNNNVIELKDLIGKNSNKPINISMLTEPLPKLNQGKISSKSFGVITSYAANTHQGIVRNYNEDRVSIIINMNKLPNYKSLIPWPKISYFAIFDGHAGNKCAEYLRENLLRLICSNKYFPENIPEAIKLGFEKADEYFLNNYAMINGQLKDNSGTCGLILLIVNNDVYIGNVGDSRCIGSFNKGKIQCDITRDHKPNTPYEKERIMANGGQIYQTKTNIKIEENFILRTKILLGPYRVYPGRLSVSRTIGDAEGKIPLIGGNPNVIISKPDIYKYNIMENDIDYFVLGCDGIFDQMSSDDVFKCVSVVVERNKELFENRNNNKNKYKSLYGNNVDIHTTSGDVVDLILKGAMLRQSYDNVTCLLISFKNLLTTDFTFLDKNALNNNKSVREKYSSQKKESKSMVYSNSNNDYLKNNNMNNKKSINIHEINKFIQKLKSSGSDSSLFKKKEEIAISNEMKEYSSKPMMNLYIKTNNNKSDKFLSNSNDNNSNHNLTLTLGTDKKNNDKKGFQIIFKNNNTNNFLYNKENNARIKYAKIQNNRNNEEKNDSSEEKKDKLFYNKKKIYFTGFKKSEPTDSKKREEPKNKERNNEFNKIKKIKLSDSRNENTFKDNKTLKLNSRILSNKLNNNSNNNSDKNIYQSETSYTLGNYNINNLNKMKGLSSSLKRISNNKDKEGNNFQHIEKGKEIIKKEIENEINNNHFTDTKLRTNNIYENIIKNKPYQVNLLKNFNDIYQNSDKNKNNITFQNNNINFDENKFNHNTSFQALNSQYSFGMKNIYPSHKRSLNVKENKEKDNKVITEYSNINKEHHRYYFTKNNNDIIYGNLNINSNSIFDNKNKYESFVNNSELKNIENKNKEPRNSDKKNRYNYNDLKNKYSHFILRSNTESNYYKNKKFQ